GVQEFVADAVDASLTDGGHLVPAPVANDPLQRDTVTGAAPGGNQDIRIVGENRFWRALDAGLAEELATCRVHQLGNPRLGGDQRLAPFFAEHFGPDKTAGLVANRFDLLLHVADHLLAAIGGTHGARDGNDVGVNV